MTTTTITLKINDITIDLHRKAVKNLNLRVYPPDGRVRVSAPYTMPMQQVKSTLNARLPWIRQKQQEIIHRDYDSAPRLREGEYHYFQGQCYPLALTERPGRTCIRITADGKLEMAVSPTLNAESRKQKLQHWYRQQLQQQLPTLLATWEPVIGKKVHECRIKRMKTRWGTCNIQARRIWLNLELIKKPPECLEYIMVHEMVHLLERNHTPRFHALMDHFLPDWRTRQKILKRLPIPCH